MALSRDNLTPEGCYYDRSAGMYAYTPDGIGCIWYETRQALIDELGNVRITSVSEISDF